MKPAWLIALALVPVAACDDEPVPSDPEAILFGSGTYTVSSTLTPQATAVLPQQAVDIVDALRGLRDQPGRTMFDLAEEAGVPALDELRSALPDSLESRIYGWIDEAMDGITYGDGPAAEAIDAVVDAAETVIGEVRLTSTLDLDAPSSTHRLRTMAFALPHVDARFDLDALAGTPVALSVQAPTLLQATPMRVSFGRHAFGLPYGELAYQAIEAEVRARYGTDVHGLLAAAIDCPAIAAEVANQCVVGVCVRNQPQLREICEGAVDYLADELHDRFAAARFDALTFDAGTGVLAEGDTLDGQADAITGGVWTATVDIGLGPRPVPATFTASRK